MRKYLAVSVVAAVAAFGAIVGTASAAGPLDQSQTDATDAQPIPGNPAFPSYRVAQTFTAGRTGHLDQVDLLLRRQLNPGDLIVEIRSAPHGVPSDAALTAVTVPESTVPSGGATVWVSVPFDVPADSVAGTEYAIVVHAPEGFCGGDCWAWLTGPGDPYVSGRPLFALDGANWAEAAETGIDFAFKTYVTPLVPTSIAECKDEGWQRFSQFRNQGDCVSFVAAHQ
jgi:hypothetical protein